MGITGSYCAMGKGGGTPRLPQTGRKVTQQLYKFEVRLLVSQALSSEYLSRPNLTLKCVLIGYTLLRMGGDIYDKSL